MKVVFTESARGDLVAIRDELRRRAGNAIAARIINELRGRVSSLATFAERGNVPPELALLGILDFRELHHPPYRVVYRVLDRMVAVVLVADGRRDFRKLLELRLLRP